MKQNISLELISRRYEADTAAMLSEHSEDAQPEELRTLTEAVMEISDEGHVDISYEEAEGTGIDGTTHLIFDISEPDIFTVQRVGIPSATMVFSPGLRHLCRYQTALMPFEMMLTTRSLSNHLLDEGWLELDYTTELERTSHTRTFLRAVISELPDEPCETESGEVMSAHPRPRLDPEVARQIDELFEALRREVEEDE